MWERIEVRGIPLIPTFYHQGRRSCAHSLAKTVVNQASPWARYVQPLRCALYEPVGAVAACPEGQVEGDRQYDSYQGHGNQDFQPKVG